VKELKRQEEKIWSDLELLRSETKARGLREKGIDIISSTCLKCSKPLKYAIELESDFAMIVAVACEAVVPSWTRVHLQYLLLSSLRAIIIHGLKFSQE
jgi:hypothetical protein